MKIVIKESELKRMVGKVLSETLYRDYTAEVEQDGINFIKQNFDIKNFYKKAKLNPELYRELPRMAYDKFGPDSKEYAYTILLSTLKYAAGYIAIVKRDTFDNDNEMGNEIWGEYETLILSNAHNFNPYRGQEENKNGENGEYDPYKDSSSALSWAKNYLKQAVAIVFRGGKSTKTPMKIEVIKSAIWNVIDELKKEGINNPSKEEVYDRVCVKYANAKWKKSGTFDDNFELAWTQCESSSVGVSIDDTIGGSEEGGQTIGDTIKGDNGDDIIEKLTEMTKQERAKYIIKAACETLFGKNSQITPEEGYDIFCAYNGLFEFYQNYGIKKSGGEGLISVQGRLESFTQKYPYREGMPVRVFERIAQNVKERVENFARNPKLISAYKNQIGADKKNSKKISKIVENAVRRALLK